MWLFSFALTKKYGTLNWEEQMLFFVIVNGTIQQFQCEKKTAYPCELQTTAASSQ